MMNRNGMIETDGRLSALESKVAAHTMNISTTCADIAAVWTRLQALETHDVEMWRRIEALELSRLKTMKRVKRLEKARGVVADAMVERVKTLEAQLKGSEFARKMNADRARRAEDELMNLKSEASKPPKAQGLNPESLTGYRCDGCTKETTGVDSLSGAPFCQNPKCGGRWTLSPVGSPASTPHAPDQ